MTGRRVFLGILAGLACFALGIGAARLMAPAPGPVPPLTEPRIVLDPGSIQLLPDASLRLELPPGFDAGPP